MVKRTSEAPVTVGLLAHVDAGKTTLAESLLYTAGKLRKFGRVDHQDAFLDTHALEKQRGITIFSKQALLTAGGRHFTLLDTPGHVDFSPETERTMQVLDYCVLVISAPDGVQGHVLTLWKLLEQHHVPVFLFINKMDQPGCARDSVMDQLKKRLSDACVDFTLRDDAFFEELATCSETALEEYLDAGRISDGVIRSSIDRRQVFPCFFGSALKLQGVDAFLEALCTFTHARTYPDAFGARVFKISRDEHGERLTHVKITGGSLRVKDEVRIHSASDLAAGDSPSQLSAPAQPAEKVNQIRLYDGVRYTLTEEAPAGSICALTGPAKTRCGDGLGFETADYRVQLVPVLSYRLLLPDGCDAFRAYADLKRLEEEEPQLNVIRKEGTDEIHVRVMGTVQLEILQQLLHERFGLDAAFGTGSIIYQETIADVVEGVGHFEPLRHYAEVHLLLEPLPRGAGLSIAADCDPDRLDLNWQRLILTHLQEKQHRGVLTGAGITDMKITLKAGKAHQKHTEGGDFREATYRAVRQGLMQAQSVLLEPYYAFRLEVPSEMIGRAMTDLQRMEARFEPAQTMGDMAVLTGNAPVVTMQDYPTEVISYTRGRGHLTCTFRGYEPCHNADAVIAASGYDPQRDPENSCGSIFCAHGAGYWVPWNEVMQHMHLPSVLPAHAADGAQAGSDTTAGSSRNRSDSGASGTPAGYGAAEKELREIFERTYGSGTFSRSSSDYFDAAGSRRRTADAAGENREQAKNSAAGSRHRASDTPGNAQAAGAGKAGTAETRSGTITGTDTGARKKHRLPQDTAQKASCLLVDGYNIIFAWEELNELAQENAEAARGRLMDILCNYQGYRGMILILVFDAYKVAGNPGEAFRYHNIHVVYTKEAETADAYIEKTVHEIGRKYDVTVATSDRLEQIIILGQGARRMSARELHEDIEDMMEELRSEQISRFSGRSGHYLFDALTEETARELEAVRLGKHPG